MCDGYYHKGGLVLCTDGFTLKDVCLLIGVLHYKFGFNCTIRTRRINQYRIYISEKSLTSLQKIVMPHIDSSMVYKIIH